MFKKVNIANTLTIFRFILIPILVGAFYIPGMLSNIIAAGLFALAAITDFFDGYFARIFHAQSNFGKCLDPIADKLIVVVAIVMLISYSDQDLWILIPGLIIICREILISGLREFMAELQLMSKRSKPDLAMHVTNLAKWKTAFQMIAITMLLLGEKGSTYTIDYLVQEEVDLSLKLLVISLIDWLGKTLFVVASMMTVITGFSYLRAGFNKLRQGNPYKEISKGRL